MPFSDLTFLFYAVNPREHCWSSLDRVPPYVSRAIPWFTRLMLVEYLVSLARKRQRLYSLKESLCSISLGIISECVPWNMLSLASYVYAFEHWRVVPAAPHDSMWSWVAMILLVDLGYYWFHRISHEWHAGWIGHSVHHSGEFYNLATALRQGVFSSLFSPWFYLPIALLGFPPQMFVTHKALNLLYQFWIHTQMVGSCGPLEYVLNTPSHHRVHHRPGGNCNYAGFLIVWDRLFGTFVSEAQQMDNYGFGKPLGTFDPVRANVEQLHRMATSVGRGEPGLRRCLRLLFSRRLPRRPFYCSPAALLSPLASGRRSSLWTPPEDESGRTSAKYDPALRGGGLEAGYLALQVGAMTALHLQRTKGPPTAARLGWTVFIAATLSIAGNIADGKRSVEGLETARTLLCSVLVWRSMPAYLHSLTLGSLLWACVCALPPAAWGLLLRKIRAADAAAQEGEPRYSASSKPRAGAAEPTPAAALGAKGE